ncbi:aldo/keto reductase [Aurantimonas sp. VKM B-3413]|uniref:aldo/keto reductase n=1 Tax=Aurantimonas sp. VKM B-3413 TaxID=2779401 RepID=UPI001E380330|nr:aldo/keto reductase [Aurantimonas sp. VKM B-3413]MCB8838974.1 aldo/keto reductase [Aurantimonas sp. VKM B-3413]
MEFARREIGRTGVEVSEYGFGGAPLGNLYAPVPEDEARALLLAAYEAGLRYFDTAPYYGFGLSERRFGDAFRQLPWQELTVSTKVGRLIRPDRGPNPDREKFIDAAPFRSDYDYSYDGVMRSHEDSLQRLGIDRVDILFLHDIGAVTHGSEAHPALFKQAMEGGYKALDELRRNGDVGAIGLGVNEWQVCEEAMDHGRWDVFLLAGRYTLLEQTALDSFLPRCEREEVSIVIGGPFNSGILATGPVAGATYDYEPAPAEILERTRRIAAVCEAHGVPLAAAALRFPLTHPRVASVIPGAAAVSHLRRNMELLERPIPAELWSDLKTEGLLRADSPVPEAG